MTLIKDTGSPGLLIRGISPAEDFSVATPSRTVTVSGSSSGTSTTQDAVTNDATSATIRTFADVRAAVPLGGYARSGATFVSSDTGVATIDAAGTLTAVAAGTTTITVTVAGLGVRKIRITVTQAGGQTSMTFAHFATGSLGKHLADTIDGLISGKTAPDLSLRPPAWNALTQLFAVNGVTGNAGGWWGAIDATCVPQHVGGGLTNGVLVTPRDMIFAAHFGAGGSVSFTASDGTTATRSISATRTLISPSGDGGDILIATLASDLPGTVTPAAVLPANFRDYLPSPQFGYPCVFTNQDRTLLIAEAVVLAPAPAGAVIYGKVIGINPPSGSRMDWYYPVRGLDSGSPAFFIIDGSLVLLTNWHYSGASGPCVADNISQINAAITANGSPYSLTTASLGDFTSY